MPLSSLAGAAPPPPPGGNTPGLWEQVRPSTGWLVALLLTVWLVFQNVLKDWLTRFFHAAGAKLYTRLAGKPLFWSAALRRYRQALHERYTKLHLSIRPNRPLGICESSVYVPLKVGGSADAAPAVEAYQLVTHCERSMVTGAPGAGKSMLLRYITLSYAQGRMAEVPGQPVPVLLALHRFNEPTAQLEEELVNELARNDFPRARRFVGSALEKGNLLLLLDGLDEVNSSERQRVVQHLRDSLERYPKCRAILTCRSAIYRGEFDGLVQQTLAIAEFNDQQIRLFLGFWAPDMRKAGKSIDQLLRTLHDRPQIMALARNPLMLTLIAYLYTDADFVLPNSRIDFYRAATDALLNNEWHWEFKHLAKATDKRLVLQHLALYNQDVSLHPQQTQLSMDRLSMERTVVLEQVRKVLGKLNIALASADAILDEIVERSGLLIAIDGGERYQFAHLTLQEYFTATALRNDAAGLLRRFKADHDAWRETAKLWCGLDHESTDVIQAIHEEDPLTAFECLADAHEVQPALADELLATFKARLGKTGVDDAVVRAFGLVASDLRPRGEAVFSSLEALLRTTLEPTLRIATANALSLTNLPPAAHILARYYAERPELRAALVRMGDLAVPALLPMIEPRPADTMDDLLTIGTPMAAQALVPWLWHADGALAKRAAWRMLALLPKPGVEEALQGYALAPWQRKARFIGWVWEPFHAPEGSALPIIAGRVAHLLARAPVELAPAAPVTFDPRVVIPLCAILKRNELGRVPPSPDERASEEHWRLSLGPDTPEDAAVVETLLRTFNPSSACRSLLAGLRVDVQARLLRLLQGSPAITEHHWCTALLPSAPGFNSLWWYYRAVVAIAWVLTGIAMFRFFSWPQVVPFWLLLLGAGIALWSVGWRRARKAHNPLQDIITPRRKEAASRRPPPEVGSTRRAPPGATPARGVG